MEKMKILVTDGQTLFQEDIPHDVFDGFGDVRWRPRTTPDAITELPQDTEVIITNKYVLDGAALAHFPKLRLVVVSATGYNCVDLAACQARNILVCNVPTYGTYSVAQHALALLLEHSNRVGLHAESVRQGEWSACPDWSYARSPIREMYGKTLGIIGMGRIGSCFAGMAEALGMPVIYHHTRDLSLPGRTFVDLHTVAATADVVSLHCPLKPDTQHLINADFIARMQPEAILLNTSRGGLIDSEALAAALKDGRIAAALLDVLDMEPPPMDHPLTGCPNAIITPHIAWISREARLRIIETMRDILLGWVKGNPKHVVS